MNTAREARSRAVVHFWPGPDINLQAGAILPCRGTLPTPAIVTRNFAEVTCRRCLSSRVFRAMRAEFGPGGLLSVGDGRGVKFDRAALVAWKLLDPAAPPAVVKEPPYRNPNLATRDPLENLVAGWAYIASDGIDFDGDRPPTTPEERRAYDTCAKELHRTLETMRRGGL